MKKNKVFEAEVKEFDEATLTVTHFISTERKDRGGDVMLADGMKIRGKPVVLLAHGYSQMGQEPVAKNLKLWKDTFKGAKGIMAKTQFFPDELGKRLWQKTTQGFMPNWSVGYIPLKWEDGRDKDGAYYREVKEWELLEYSPVGVPMNPDAQSVDKGAIDKVWFKFVEDLSDPEYKALEVERELEEKLGDNCSYKDGQLVDAEEKPYPNEHACRISDPGKYDRFKRQNNKFGDGIHAIWGIKEGEPVELQAIRLSKDKFTAQEARAWLKEHKYTCHPFEPASEKCEECGQEMFYIFRVDGKVRDLSDADICSLEGELIGPVSTCGCRKKPKKEEEDVVKRLEKLEAALGELVQKVTELPGLVTKTTVDPPPGPVPKELRFVDDEAEQRAADEERARQKTLVVGLVREVVGDLLHAEVRKMLGKVD